MAEGAPKFQNPPNPDTPLLESKERLIYRVYRALIAETERSKGEEALAELHDAMLDEYDRLVAKYGQELVDTTAAAHILIGSGSHAAATSANEGAETMAQIEYTQPDFPEDPVLTFLETNLAKVRAPKDQ